MKSTLIFGVFTLATSAASWLLSLPDRSAQKILDSPTTILRELQPGDIPALTTLLIAAFSPGPIYHYIAPDLPAHYAKFWYCMNASITQSWESHDRNNTIGMVVAVEDTPVSAAIWHIRSRDQELARFPGFGSLSKDCTPLPGVNETRGQDFDRQNVKIQQQYFASVYPRQLYLNVLATHPKWDGYGFAARHLDWGKEFSLKLSGPAWPVTLLATPVGWPLYDSVEFQSIANVTVRMLDGLGDLWFEVMRWKGR